MVCLMVKVMIRSGGRSDQKMAEMEDRADRDVEAGTRTQNSVSESTHAIPLNQNKHKKARTTTKAKHFLFSTTETHPQHNTTETTSSTRKWPVLVLVRLRLRRVPLALLPVPPPPRPLVLLPLRPLVLLPLLPLLEAQPLHPWPSQQPPRRRQRSPRPHPRWEAEEAFSPPWPPSLLEVPSATLLEV